MELTNIQHSNNEIEEILLIEFKENQEIVAQLFISKDNIDLEKYIFATKNTKVIYPSMILKEGPFTHIIAITTLSSKDSYITPSNEIEKEHKQILTEISNFITNVTGIFPTYTKTDGEIVESIETFSARVIVDINLINEIIKYLKETNTKVKELEKENHEEQLIKTKKYV